MSIPDCPGGWEEMWTGYSYFMVGYYSQHKELKVNPPLPNLSEHRGQRRWRWAEPRLPGLLLGGVPRPAGDRVPWPWTLQLLRCAGLLLVNRHRGAGSVRPAAPADAKGGFYQQDKQVGYLSKPISCIHMYLQWRYHLSGARFAVVEATALWLALQSPGQMRLPVSQMVLPRVILRAV